MNDLNRSTQDVLHISPEKEKQIWEHFIGLYIDRFIGADQTIDIEGLRQCLATKLGPLFADHAAEFEAILQRLNDPVDATRAGLQSLLGQSFQELRVQSHADYPTFESQLRVANQEQNGFTPLTPNRMVSYQVDGEYIYLHIQPSYAVADKSGTIEAAMNAMADELRNNVALKPVQYVSIDSWLVKDRPQRWQELGFIISQKNKSFAYVPVEEFKRRWSVAD